MGFKQGLARVLHHEGYYSNNDKDKGGETYRGISRRWFPKWKGWEIIDTYDDKSQLSSNKILEVEVENFYYAFFWVKIRAYEIEDDFIAEMLFNFSVNIGKKVCTHKVQRILKITQDGIIGPKTIHAINQAIRSEFIYQFLLEITDLYVHILNKDRTQEVFIRGWLNRVMSFYYEFQRLV